MMPDYDTPPMTSAVIQRLRY